jgi:hypothetical protein
VTLIDRGAALPVAPVPAPSGSRPVAPASPSLDGARARPASEALCVWSGLACVLFLGAGFLIAGLIPPPSPADSPAEAAAYWRHDLDARRVGITLLVIGSTLFVTFGAAVATQLRRIEGPGSPAAFVALAAATVTATTAIVYAMFMMVIVFRPEMPDDLIRAISDLAWLPFVALWSPGALQAIAVGVAVLGDRRPEPLLPRWVGWFSFWMAFTSLAGSLVPFFRTGPMAWNGFVAFYVAASVFFAWYVVMFVVLRRGLRAGRA